MTYVPEMKECLIFAMTLSLNEIQTYTGYKGANILKVSFRDESDANKMVAHCISMGIAPKKSFNKGLLTWDVFCPYEMTDIYYLKD